METHISSLFHVRKDKKSKENLFPIYLRVTINGERFEFSTQRYVPGEKWSQALGKAIGRDEKTKSINNYLDVLLHKVFVYQKELTLEEKDISIKAFKNKWFGIIEENKMILEVFKEHNYPNLGSILYTTL